MNIIKRILRLFIKPEKEIIIGEFRRNELCYCGSGLKFKKCHLVILGKNKQTAYKILNTETKQESIKVLNKTPKRNKPSPLYLDVG